MVQTRSVTARIKSGHVHDGQVPQQHNSVRSSPGRDTPPPTKRQRQDGAESAGKRRRGKRAELCQLNLDVLFLIAEYIQPMDLLNLARTCKSLRELLMDKSSAFVWKTALCQVDKLPECPTDLTEPEYVNLVFCTRCHSCGKQARAVLWRLRRRYCAGCKPERLCNLSDCDVIIRESHVLAVEHLTLDKDTSAWVDKDQMVLFLDEYRRSGEKKQFLNERQEQKDAILRHARRCDIWSKCNAVKRRDDLALRREKREESIFDKLKEHGYGREIEHYGLYGIRASFKSVFRTSKPLTDKEWNQMWPQWRDIMSNIQARRMDTFIFPPRRSLLEREYKTYLAHPTPDGPMFDLLPDMYDLVRFGPFRDIIRAPEGTEMGDTPFASAFAQLPDLVDGWKKKLDADLAELVKIPLHLSPRNTPDGQGTTSSSTGHVEIPQTDLNRLHLACALFHLGVLGSFTHLDVFSVCTSTYYDFLSENETKPIQDRFRIQFLDEAPYIVRECGLDPYVTTVDDMDHQDARLRCLLCEGQADTVMDWRSAMWHASLHVKIARTPLSEVPRWELVSNEDKPRDLKQGSSSDKMHCLLCRRYVGCAVQHYDTLGHIIRAHGIANDEIKEGVHYAYVGIRDFPPKAVEAK